VSHALRQREIKVNSPHGLRAKEIASLTWDMATNSGGEIGTGVHLTRRPARAGEAVGSFGGLTPSVRA